MKPGSIFFVLKEVSQHITVKLHTQHISSFRVRIPRDFSNGLLHGQQNMLVAAFLLNKQCSLLDTLLQQQQQQQQQQQEGVTVVPEQRNMTPTPVQGL